MNFPYSRHDQNSAAVSEGRPGLDESDARLEALVCYYEHDHSPDFLLTSKELRFEINQDKAEKVNIKGQALDLEKTYLVALPDYIANGGDKCFFLKEQKRIETGKLIRDVLLEYIASCKKEAIIMDTKLDGRIRVAK